MGSLFCFNNQTSDGSGKGIDKNFGIGIAVAFDANANAETELCFVATRRLTAHPPKGDSCIDHEKP
jgi:hypothetical protein